MKTIELEVEIRNEIGKGWNRKLRVLGKTPAVLYGRGKKNFTLQTGSKVLAYHLTGHNENAIYLLKSTEKEVNGKHVLVKSWDKDIIKRTPLHCDFFEIDLTKDVTVKVPLHFVGKAKGAAEGGVVSPIIRELEVSCLPTMIPDFIDVDVSNLGVGESIHVEELVVPAGIKKVIQDNFTIVTCSFIKEEVVAVAPVEGAVATTAEPEVIAKGKKEEGEEGAAPAKGAAAPAAAKGAAPAKDNKK